MKKYLKIYLASSFDYVEHVKRLANFISLQGHSVNCEWWHTDFKEVLRIKDKNNWFNHPIISIIYERTLQAIKECDVLIFVTPEERKYNGANVEVGIALALGKPVVAFGELEKSGMYARLIRCNHIDDLKPILKELSV